MIFVYRPGEKGEAVLVHADFGALTVVRAHADVPCQRGGGSGADSTKAEYSDSARTRDETHDSTLADSLHGDPQSM